MTQIELETMTAVKAAAKKYAYQSDEQRRYEIAKCVLAHIAESEYKQGLAKVAVSYANELIKELKK